ncbi:hypothetical protein HYT25_05000 [Candidatus Pacearchaeota archaeon]|nr:hypothetical protein [Candidatus Pacearchaeota archaeon]
MDDGIRDYVHTSVFDRIREGYLIKNERFNVKWDMNDLAIIEREKMEINLFWLDF